jgi:hypothetical protein
MEAQLRRSNRGRVLHHRIQVLRRDHDGQVLMGNVVYPSQWACPLHLILNYPLIVSQ